MSDEVQEHLRKEGLALAPLSRRAYAFFIDELILAFLFLLIIYEQITGVQDPDTLVALINSYTFEYLILKVVYQTLFVLLYGATLGKIAMKIQVIDVETFQKPLFNSALNRGIFRAVSEMIFYIGFVWAFYNPNRQGWHDKTARTLVVDV